MAKFNAATANATKTINRAGGEAHSQSTKLELVSLVLTSFLKDTFYESGSDRLARLQSIVQGLSDKKFAAKAAVYARNEFGMRSVTHAIAGEIAQSVKATDWTRRFFNRVVRRVDDMTEILAYYEARYGRKKTPNALKRGFADAVHKFDRYQLAKYRGEGNMVSLVDLFNVVHPKPLTEDEEVLYRDLMTGKLKSVDTWESKLTIAGQKGDGVADKAKMKAESWKELLTEDKLGYFALLRNLRNIAQQAPEVVDVACAKLVDARRIKGSLVLPFRFMTALKSINSAELPSALRRKLDSAIRVAADIALTCVPDFDGDTLVVLDDSRSMTWSDNNPAEIGSMFAAVLYKACNADLMLFGKVARYMTPDHNASVLTICDTMCGEFNSGGTNFHSIFQTANKKYDRIIILSDMQGWMGRHTPVKSFRSYKQQFDADPSIFSFDLSGYGDMMFPERSVYCVAGFSEKVLKLMSMLENDRDAMVHAIEAVEI